MQEHPYLSLSSCPNTSAVSRQALTQSQRSLPVQLTVAEHSGVSPSPRHPTTPPHPPRAPRQLQEKQQELEQQYESYAAELERERQLNEAMRLSGSVLEALKDQKEDCVAVLQAAAAARVAAAEEEEALAKQQQQQQEQPRMPHQAPVVVEELSVQSAGEVG